MVKDMDMAIRLHVMVKATVAFESITIDPDTGHTNGQVVVSIPEILN